VFTCTDAKKVEVDDVEDILIQVMNDEFNTVLEDDSAYMACLYAL
jgi:pre-rRNA-processing protein TSR2